MLCAPSAVRCLGRSDHRGRGRTGGSREGQRAACVERAQGLLGKMVCGRMVGVTQQWVCSVPLSCGKFLACVTHACKSQWRVLTAQVKSRHRSRGCRWEDRQEGPTQAPRLAHQVPLNPPGPWGPQDRDLPAFLGPGDPAGRRAVPTGRARHNGPGHSWGLRSTFPVFRNPGVGL